MRHLSFLQTCKIITNAFGVEKGTLYTFDFDDDEIAVYKETDGKSEHVASFTTDKGENEFCVVNGVLHMKNSSYQHAFTIMTIKQLKD